MKHSDIGHLLKNVNEKMIFLANSNFKNCGLTQAQGYVLSYIYKNGGSVTQKEIDSFLNVSHPTVVGLVSRLEQNGFVSVTIDEHDRRNRIITHTEKALDVKKEFDITVLKHEAILDGTLTNEEKQQLLDLLKKVNDGLKIAINDIKEKNND